MLRFFTSHRPIRLFASLLCMGVLATSLFYSAPVAHAARPPAPSPDYIQGPPIQCLDVGISNVWGQGTVYISTPPGGAVRYNLELYVTVTSPCPSKNYPVSGITVYGQADIMCPDGAGSPFPPAIVFHGPYSLYAGGGYGQDYVVTDYCVVLENGVPTASVVPTHIYMTITASGTLIEGQAIQNVTSNTKTIGVW